MMRKLWGGLFTPRVSLSAELTEEVPLIFSLDETAALKCLPAQEWTRVLSASVTDDEMLSGKEVQLITFLRRYVLFTQETMQHCLDAIKGSCSKVMLDHCVRVLECRLQEYHTLQTHYPLLFTFFPSEIITTWSGSAVCRGYLAGYADFLLDQLRPLQLRSDTEHLVQHTVVARALCALDRFLQTASFRRIAHLYEETLDKTIQLIVAEIMDAFHAQDFDYFLEEIRKLDLPECACQAALNKLKVKISRIVAMHRDELTMSLIVVDLNAGLSAFNGTLASLQRFKKTTRIKAYLSDDLRTHWDEKLTLMNACLSEYINEFVLQTRTFLTAYCFFEAEKCIDLLMRALRLFEFSLDDMTGYVKEQCEALKTARFVFFSEVTLKYTAMEIVDYPLNNPLRLCEKLNEAAVINTEYWQHLKIIKDVLQGKMCEFLERCRVLDSCSQWRKHQRIFQVALKYLPLDVQAVCESQWVEVIEQQEQKLLVSSSSSESDVLSLFFRTKSSLCATTGALSVDTSLYSSLMPS